MIDLANIDPASLSPHQQEIIDKTIAEAQNQGIDPNLAIAVANQESDFHHLKDGKLNCSEKGACGAFQLMPETAKKLGINPRNIDQNIKGGIALLKENLNRYDNNDLLATLAYNTSEATRNKFMETGDPSVLPEEAINYVKKIHSQHPLKGVIELGAENNPFLGDHPSLVVQDIRQEQQDLQPATEENKLSEDQASAVQPYINKATTNAESLYSNYPAETVGAGLGAASRILSGPPVPSTPPVFQKQLEALSRVQNKQKSAIDSIDKASEIYHETKPAAENAIARAQELHDFIHETDPTFKDYLKNYDHYPTPEDISVIDQGRGSAPDKLGTTGIQGTQFNENTSNRAAITRVNKGIATDYEKKQAQENPKYIKNKYGFSVSREEALKFHSPDRLQKKAALDEANAIAQKAQQEHALAEQNLKAKQRAAADIEAENQRILEGASPTRLEKAKNWASQRLAQMESGVSPKGVRSGAFISGVAGGLSGHEFEQMKQRYGQGDLPGAAISGLGGISALAATAPKYRPLGILGGLGTLALEAYRNKLQNQPQANIQTKGLTR